MGNKELIARLLAQGYLGDFSFEPFSAKVQELDSGALKKALTESLAYLGVT
jgi:predicted xylose isomerase-like sugar epimerase